jgi:hypothetical protein
MLKRLNPELVFGFLLAFAFWAVVLLWQSAHPEYSKTESHSCVGTKSECVKVTTDEKLADYTWWLAVLTAALVIVSAGQGYFLLRSDRTARISADAAKKSAEAAEAALFKVEVAYPYAMIRDHWINVEQNRIRGVNMGTVVSFYFTNHGRTPAAITEVFCQLYCERGIPPPILPPDRPYNWFDGTVVPAGQDSKDFTFNMNQGMFDGYYAGKFADESNIVWLIGYARYEDVFDNKYILGFCFAFGTQKATFYPVGGDGYNYRKKIGSAKETANTA